MKENELVKQLHSQMKNKQDDDTLFWAIGDYRYKRAPGLFTGELRIGWPHMEQSYAPKKLLVLLQKKRSHENDAIQGLFDEQYERLDKYIHEFGLAFGLVNWLTTEAGFDGVELYSVEKNLIINTDEIFLSKDEALEHLKANKADYTKNAHPRQLALRIPTIEKLLDIIKNLDYCSDSDTT